MDIQHLILNQGVCSCRGHTVKSQLPKEDQTGYGPRLSAQIAEISGIQGNSRETVRIFCRSVLGFSISTGVIQKVIDRASEALRPAYDRVGNIAWTSRINHVDGEYSIVLGEFDPEDFSNPVYFGVTVGSDPEMEPRIEFTATPFSIRAADSDRLGGLEPSFYDQSSHTALTNNPHNVTPSQIDALCISDFNWGNLSDIPAGFADGTDDTGITSESDPTVDASVKDGISWNEISEIPAGFADGVDDVSTITEEDPQVGLNIENMTSKWDGSALVSGSIYDDGRIGIGTTALVRKQWLKFIIAIAADGLFLVLHGLEFQALMLLIIIQVN